MKLVFYKVSFRMGTQQRVEGGFGTHELASRFAIVLKDRGAREITITKYAESR